MGVSFISDYCKREIRRMPLFCNKGILVINKTDELWLQSINPPDVLVTAASGSTKTQVGGLWAEQQQFFLTQSSQPHVR